MNWVNIEKSGNPQSEIDTCLIIYNGEIEFGMYYESEWYFYESDDWVRIQATFVFYSLIELPEDIYNDSSVMIINSNNDENFKQYRVAINFNSHDERNHLIIENKTYSDAVLSKKNMEFLGNDIVIQKYTEGNWHNCEV